MANGIPQTDLEQLTLYRPVATFQPGREVKRPAQYGKYFCYFTQALPLLASAQGFRGAQFTSDGKYLAFAVQKITCFADSLQAKALVVIQPSGEQFSSDPMFITHYGGGQFPRIVHPAWIIRANNVVTAVLDDRQLVPANNNVRIAYHGQKVSKDPIVPPMKYNAAKQFTYPANFTANDSGQGAILPNATKTYTINVDADSDFEVQAITVASDGPITLQTTTDADNWFDTDIRSELLGGAGIEIVAGPLDPTGWHPFILPAPRWLMGSAYIKTTVTNQVNANNRVEVQYHGVRLYPAGGIQ